MGIQPKGRCFRLGWPLSKAPGGKAFLTQPKTLAIENQALQRLAPPTRKNHQSTRHRVDFEMLPAHLRQAVYPLAEIHRLDRQPNPHLRGDLDHAPDLQNASAKPTRSNPSLPSQRIVILAPSPRANSTVQFGPSTGCPTRGSSTNPGGGLRRDRRGGVSRLRPPFESVVIQAQPLRDAADSMSAGQRRRQSPKRSGYPFSARARFSPNLQPTACLFNIQRE